MTFGNYGFMGNFIILGVWGDDFFFKYTLFVFMVGILCNSWGLYILIPKEKNASLLDNLKKEFDIKKYFHLNHISNIQFNMEAIHT